MIKINTFPTQKITIIETYNNKHHYIISEPFTLLFISFGHDNILKFLASNIYPKKINSEHRIRYRDSSCNLLMKTILSPELELTILYLKIHLRKIPEEDNTVCSI